jgi:hypothetical protein
MILFAVLLGGCPAQLPVEVTAFAGSRKYTIDVDTVGVTTPVSVSADSAWNLLPPVYAALGLPLDEHDAKARRLGTCWKRVRGRLGGSQVSRYLDCGELRQMPNADAYDVDVLVLTAIRQEGGSAGIATIVLGWANAPGGGRQWCQSRGALEKRIHDAVGKSQ